MTWVDPEAGKAFFQTNDQPTQAQLYTYILENLLSVMHPIDVTTADLDVVNTLAETTLYAVTIPANSLGSNGEARMEIIGDARGTAAGSHIVTVRVKFGGTTLVTFTRDYTNNTVRNAAVADIRVVNQGAANAQLVVASLTEPGPDGGGDVAVQYVTPVAAAIDTTVDQQLLVSVQWNGATATNSIRRLSARTLLGKN